MIERTPQTLEGGACCIGMPSGPHTQGRMPKGPPVGRVGPTVIQEGLWAPGWARWVEEMGSGPFVVEGGPA